MSSENVSGLLAAATATVAMASIALLQKTRAPAYDPKNRKSGGPRRPSASLNGHSHVTMVQAGRALADPAEGYELFPIDFSMHAQIRQNVVHQFLQTHPQTKSSAAAILVHGGVEVDRYDTDIQYNFHQESFFQYLFGVREPGCAGLVDLSTGSAVLFVPRLNDEWELWCGDRKPLAYFKAHYKVDDVFYVDEMAAVLADKLKAKKLFVLHGQNTDSQALDEHADSDRQEAQTRP
ncbi:Xaa-Pro dipeptidase [Phytophthora ramorum]|uniref:Xaa-Pro dipeptidase n=1 Tax=Phytophthora ramorum TaxID=164328 RepID=UPI003096B7D6|nr:Xaa-Pro dipeptidase [Phytophthora ramorum]